MLSLPKEWPSHISSWFTFSVGLLVIPSLHFPDTESGMKIHLPLSWPLVGAGVLLGFPGWKIMSPRPSYISWPVWRRSAGPPQGFTAQEKNIQDKLQATMMMLKVEDLVRKTHYLYTMKAGCVLAFIWKLKCPFLSGTMHRYSENVIYEKRLLYVMK